MERPGHARQARRNALRAYDAIQEARVTHHKEFDALPDEDRLTTDLTFGDPYFLDFLGLADLYSERDLEAAILREMEAFLLELGAGFSFVARQKRIVVDGRDYIDLLFHHRRLRRLILIELKLRDFQPADKRHVELYLRWLDRYERCFGAFAA